MRRLWLGSIFALAAVSVVQADSFVGQIACSQCWYEAKRPDVPYGTEGDLACAARCAKAGVPAALAVRTPEGSFELLLLADDTPAAVETWLSVTGRFARIGGDVEGDGDLRVLSATSVELLDESPWEVSRDAPPAELAWTDLRGRTVALDDYRGRVVVLNFWATWCAPCRKEMPDLARIQREYAVFGVQVVGASADEAGQAESVLEYARAARVNFPVLLGATTAQMQALGLGVVLPATVVLDEDGHVVARFDGVVERRELGETLDRLLDGDGEQAHADHDHRPGGHRHDVVASGGLAPNEASLVPS